MRALLVLAALAANASADSPRGIALATEHSELLGGHARLRLAEGMISIGEEGATLEWGAMRFTLECTALPARAGDLRERLTGDPALGCARIERLAIVRAGAAYGATASVAHLANGRTLVFAAVVSAPNASVAMLRFYVSADGVDDARAWATLARSIVLTIELHGEPSPPPPAPVEVPLQGIVLPVGWQVVAIGSTQRIASPSGGCIVNDSELDARAKAPASASHLPGRMRGELVYWSVWKDRAGRHAETLVGAAHEGQVHALCDADTLAELAKQRQIAEALWP